MIYRVQTERVQRRVTPHAGVVGRHAGLAESTKLGRAAASGAALDAAPRGTSAEGGPAPRGTSAKRHALYTGPNKTRNLPMQTFSRSPPPRPCASAFARASPRASRVGVALAYFTLRFIRTIYLHRFTPVLTLANVRKDRKGTSR